MSKKKTTVREYTIKPDKTLDIKETVVFNTDNEFVKEVQQELLSNNTDIERMRKAYAIITGGGMANVRVMKLAILNHSNWTE